MHVFQPFNESKLDFNPYTIAGEAGICITVEDNDRLNAFSSTMVTFGKMWNKNIILVFVRESTYTKEILDSSDFFSVTFFDDSYKTSLKYLKSVSGRVENKIEQIGMHVNKKIDIPYIDEGNLVFLCDKLACISMDTNISDNNYIVPNIEKKFYSEGDYHCMFVGEILETMAR